MTAIIRRHPVYWFNDGSVVVSASDDQPDSQKSTVLFRIHESLLRRHAKCDLVRQSEAGWDVPMITLPPTLGVNVADFTSLLAYLYHDAPLSAGAPFSHVAALLRVSAPEQLDIPTVHALARTCFEGLFPSGPTPFVHPRPLDEALSLAVRYGVTSVQKGIYYSIVTTTDFEGGQGGEAEAEGVDSTTKTRLTPADVERCRNLLNEIVAHFTPVLFEPPVASHMACSHLLAEKWHPLVTQSAIAGDGLYKPLEVLEQIKQIDWTAEGLCPSCVRVKTEEWTHEQEEVWNNMDGWLALGSLAGLGSELEK